MRLYKPEVEAQRFWNPYTQAMSRADLDRLHLKKLQTVIAYAYARSPMYRNLLDRNHVRPEQIRTMDDFVKRLPFIDKKEILDAQAVNPPFGQALATSEDFFHQRFATSGSTGAPLHIPLTYHSAELWGESWVYVYWAAGLRARHSFYFPFNWGIFAAFWSAYMGVRRLGATVSSRGAGSIARRGCGRSSSTGRTSCWRRRPMPCTSARPPASSAWTSPRLRS